MTKTRLQFGNEQDIIRAQGGQMCKCKHPKTEHFGSGCRQEVKKRVECDYGFYHVVENECECAEFEVNPRMNFDSQKGVFIP